MNEKDIFFDKIRKNLLKAPNDELLLLKAHLIAEEIIDRGIIYYLGKENAENLNLSFSKKLILISGLTHVTIDNEVFKKIKTINKIRNNFAHNLDYNIKNDLVKFINVISGEKISNEVEDKKYIGYLTLCLSYLLGNLWGIVNVQVSN